MMRTSSSSSQRRWLAAIVIAAASAYAAAIFQNRFTVNGHAYFTLWDDAMTSMQYARELATGHGPVWYPTQPHVEGYTSTLWMLILATIHLLVPLPDRLMSLPVMILGAALMLVNLVLAFELARAIRPKSSVVPLFVAVATAAYWPLAYWSIRGTEVSLVTALVTATSLAAIRFAATPRPGLALLSSLISALVLVRDDMIPFAILAAGFATLVVPSAERRRVLVTLAIPAALVVAAHTVFRLMYYGYPLPNSYYLKMAGGSASIRVGRGVVWVVVDVLGQLFVPLVFGVVAVLYARSKTVMFLAGALLLQLSYSAYVGGDISEWLLFTNRFVTPLVVPLFVLAAIGIEEVVRRRESRRLTVILTVVFLTAGTFVAGNGLRLLPIHSINHGIEAIPRAATQWYLWTALTGLILLYALMFHAHRAFLAAALGVFTIVSTTGYAIQELRLGTDMTVAGDWNAVRSAVTFERTTRPGTTIAVGTAGEMAYFSRRDTYDLLGKSDSVIAHGPAVGFFVPGHNKWSYQHTIRDLQPSVVAELWFPTFQNLRDFVSWGYRPLTPCTDVLVRRHALGVDTKELAAYLRRTHPCGAS
jgi:hypothetical protein